MLSNKVIKISLHFAFWGGFLGLFLLQNPDNILVDFSLWLFILSVTAIAVYVNLYLLLPSLFFKKKYWLYLTSLILVLLFCASVLFSLLPRGHPSYGTPFYQHVINLFFFVFLSSSASFLKNQFTKQKRLDRLEKVQLKSELQLLKAQVNPHFLLNTLNNLYGLILEKENDDAAEVVLKLSGLMRYLLESNKKELVSLKNEISFIEDYIKLEGIRASTPLQINFDKELDRDDAEVIPMLLIPFVENIFKHAHTDTDQGSFARIKLFLKGNELKFYTENTFREESLKNSTKVGLKNLEQRLQLAYPNHYALNIQQNSSKFYASLKIEL
jgi:sensor histidine kinase YesM